MPSHLQGASAPRAAITAGQASENCKAGETHAARASSIINAAMSGGAPLGTRVVRDYRTDASMTPAVVSQAIWVARSASKAAW
jgi:hypothetical protein